MTQVDLSFLCTAHQVHERAAVSAFKVFLTIEGDPYSIETLAERCSYSRTQMNRILGLLTWHDPEHRIAPVLLRSGGKRGRRYSYSVNRQRAIELGLINDAA